jgi:hypothetical protein
MRARPSTPHRVGRLARVEIRRDGHAVGARDPGGDTDANGVKDTTPVPKRDRALGGP